MKLTTAQARTRLIEHDHGVLCTLHPERGVDAVPVVYALQEGHLGIPIDTVKAKSSTRLQRVRNLAGDPRATLLIDQWHHADWDALWWVRAGLRWLAAPAEPKVDTLGDLLVSKYPQYRDRPFAQLLVFELGVVTGWAAS